MDSENRVIEGYLTYSERKKRKMLIKIKQRVNKKQI